MLRRRGIRGYGFHGNKGGLVGNCYVQIILAIWNCICFNDLGNVRLTNLLYVYLTGSETCPWDLASEYQVHVTSDVSYSIRQYLYSTNDIDFLYDRGARTMALEIARFWESRCMTTERGTEIYGMLVRWSWC